MGPRDFATAKPVAAPQEVGLKVSGHVHGPVLSKPQIGQRTGTKAKEPARRV